MYEIRIGGVRCRISLLYPALLTALMLCRPDGVAVSCLFASAVHEGGHLLAMLCLHCPPDACTLGVYGARIDVGKTHLPGYRGSILISLAGPTVNLLCAPLLWLCGCPRAAVVHGVLCLFNLLPAAALDGGQILRCVLCLHGYTEKADTVLRTVSAIVLFPLATAAAYTVLSGRSNITLLLVSVYLIGLIFFSPE